MVYSLPIPMAVNKKNLPSPLKNIAQALVRADSEKRGHHAFLLYGPPKCGKSCIIQNVLNQISNHPSTSPDIAILDAAIDSNIEYVRGFISSFQSSPLVASRRIGVLYNIEQLSIQGLNALLKTLEEPPLSCIIFLTTNDLRFVPETIISRTAKIYVPPLSHEELTDFLSTHKVQSDVETFLPYIDGAIERIYELDDDTVRENIADLLHKGDTLIAQPLSIFNFTTTLKKDELQNIFPVARNLWIHQLRHALATKPTNEKARRFLEILKKLVHIEPGKTTNLQIQLENIWVG